MGEVTGISWVDASFSPWLGCTKISPACSGCYAANLMDTRLHKVEWGGDRVRTKDWRKPVTWNEKAMRARQRMTVFPSLCDPFDNQVDPTWRADFFLLMHETPWITWLLLTKRIGNVVRLGPEPHMWPRNAALGVTVIDQMEANRDVPLMQRTREAIPAIPFTFISFEPGLAHVDLREAHRSRHHFRKVDWVIAGGETDQGEHMARPFNPAWARSLRDQCERVGIPFHFKSWGEWVAEDQAPPDFEWPALGRAPKTHYFPGEQTPVWKVGKKNSGRLLDGVLHDAKPELIHV